MNQKYTIKTKPQGAAKYMTFGNVTPGDKGPRMGLRVTPELRKMVADTPDGQWLNFLLFVDDGERGNGGQSGQSTGAYSRAVAPIQDDDLPF